MTAKVDTALDFRHASSHYRDEIFTTDFAATEYDCYNRDAKYSSPQTITQIKKTFESHLMIKQIFRTVITSTKPSDLHIKFELHDFSVHSEVNRDAKKTANTAAQFGAIGGIAGGVVGGMAGDIANESRTSPFEYSIIYRNIYITDSNGKRILLIPEFKSQRSKVDTIALTDCMQAFTILNQKLKEHNDKLLNAIADSLAAR